MNQKAKAFEEEQLEQVREILEDYVKVKSLRKARFVEDTFVFQTDGLSEEEVVNLRHDFMIESIFPGRLEYNDYELVLDVRVKVRASEGIVQ